MAKATILVVDDERLIRWSLRERLQEEGHEVVEAETGQEALERARDGVDVVLLDLRLPDAEGLTVLEGLRARSPDAPVILMTAHSSIESAVEAMKAGAFHYVRKPLDMDELLVLVANALETTRLRREVKSLRASVAAPYSLGAVIGQSPAMRRVLELLARIARSPASTVLLTGESGTGKDLAAKVIHYGSDRAAGPFQNITCSAISETLLESELFGHERGAFTDARSQRKGLLELAHGGTVFLDEIGEMTPSLQSKLLRFLEEKEFKRVGGSADVRVDVRIIAATNRDLRKDVQAGRFREDLFYRLQVLPVEMPPLRDRPGDVPLLVRHYVEVFNREFRRAVVDVEPQAMRALESHGWPGNVRELRNAVERAMLLCDGPTLTLGDFPALAPAAGGACGVQLPAGGLDFEQLERDLVCQALRRAGGNQTRAAALLGMNRDQIRYRIEKFGLKPDAESAVEAG